MKLYKEILINSAEQAEALPEGTVAINTPSAKWDMAYMRTDHNPPWYASTDGDSHTYHDEMVGCIALVPIEAEEETMRRPSTPLGDAIRRVYGHDSPPLTRLTTPWTPASD